MLPTNKLHYRTMSDGQSRKVFTVDADGHQHLLAFARFDASSGRFSPEWLDEAPDNKAEIAAFIDRMTSRRQRKAKDEAAPETDEAEHDTQAHSPSAVNAHPDAVEANNIRDTDDPGDALPGDIPESEVQVPREKLVIFCEGETECAYLTGFVSYLGLENRVDVRTHPIKEPGGAFKQVASRMLWERQMGKAEWSEAWLVFDRDGHAGYHEAFELVEHFPFMHLAFTNPCFEYWLLLHFEKFNGVLPKDREIVLEKTVETNILRNGIKHVATEALIEVSTKPENCLAMLKRLEPHFKKGEHPHFESFGSKLALAYERGKAAGRPDFDQGTGLPDLIDRLCDLAGRTPQDVMDDLKTKRHLKIKKPSVPPWNTLTVLSNIIALDIFDKDFRGLSEATYKDVKGRVAEVLNWFKEEIPDGQEIEPIQGKLFDQLHYVVNIGSMVHSKPGQKQIARHGKSFRKLYRALISMDQWLNTWKRNRRYKESAMRPPKNEALEGNMLA